MKLSKLGKQLVREAKANPKKTVVLVLLMLVAGYKLAPSSAASTDAEEGQGTLAEPLAGEATGSSASTVPKARPAGGQSPPWRDTAAEIDRDPLARPFDFEGEWRDPFGGERSLDQQDDDDLAATRVTPESLGLSLKSTIVGAGRRVALINGKAYGEGREIPTNGGGAVVLTKILQKRVVLDYYGTTLELSIAPGAASQALDLRIERN